MLVTAVMLTTTIFPSFAFATISEKTDWTANWIWDSEIPATLPEEGDVWMNFRKSFTLDSLPEQAVIAKIAAESRYWLYVNGKLAVFEGGLKRGVDRENGYFDNVDITKYLQVGQNTIAVAVWYYGVAGTASGDSRNQSFTGRCAEAAGFMFEANIGDTVIKSDESWKVKRDSAYLHSKDFETELPNYRFLESNVYYDARNEISDKFMGWTESAFDDSSWTAATVRGSYGDSPWNKLFERNIPLLRFDADINEYQNPEAYEGYTYTPTSSETVIEMALPYNAQVTAYLEVEADAGKKIDIRTDTYTYSSGNAANSVRTNYITKDGVQEFESLGWFSGEKVIYTIPAGVRIIKLGYRESGYDTDFAGSFVSDDEALNTLWQKAVRTLYITMRDNYMDCPDRERAQWWGDTTNEMYMTFYSLDSRSWDLYEKGLYTKLGFIQDDILYTVVPNTNYYAELPMQELAGVVGVWEYYMNSGRKYIIEDFYEAGKNYLYLWDMQQNGLIEHRGGSSSWLKWCDWGSNNDLTAIENAWYYMALGAVINMAELVGKTEDIPELKLRQSKIAEAFPSLWTDAGFKSSDVSAADDRANALAVLAGLTTDEQNAVILEKVFLNEACYFASPYMEYYVLEALTKIGTAEDVQTRIKTRYREMIESDISTLYEYWSFPEGSGSKNHAWTGGPLVTMSKHMAGISPLEKGYEKYQIKPSFGSLNYIEATVPSAVGNIGTKMSRDENGCVIMNVDAPEGADAVVAVPRIKGKSTYVYVNDMLVFNGTAVDNTVSGVVYSKNDSDYIYFDVTHGSYSFVTSLGGEAKDEYQLNITNTAGGNLSATVGGESVDLPLDTTVASGTEVTVTATADAGYRFAGFTSTVGSDDTTLTFTVTADTKLCALFEKEDTDTAKKVTVSIPDDSDVFVTLGGTRVYDGESIYANEGETLTLSACDGKRFRFVNWQGDVYSKNNSITFTAERDMNIEVKSAHAYVTLGEASNAALGGTVTSSNGQTIGTWLPAGLTDGNYDVGFTSTQQSETTAQWIVVDMGAEKTFNAVTLYPRTDEVCNFPRDFKVSVSKDGTAYTDFATVTNATNVTDPYVLGGELVSARYIRLDITRLGNKSATEGRPRLQIMELEASIISVSEKNDVNVSLDPTSSGSGKVYINNVEYTLPATVNVSRDELTKIEVAADKNCSFAGMAGDIASNSSVTYLYVQNDLELMLTFGSHAPENATAENPVNIARGKSATASGTYYTNTQWRLANLTDGVHGTDAGFSSKTSPATPYDIIIDLGSKQDFDSVVMYARNTALSSGGYCSYFPTAFTISVSADGSSYETVRTVSGETNILPENYRRVYGLSKTVNAQYIKISVTGLGLKENGSGNSHIQLQEIEDYNTGNLLAGASATDSAGNFQSAGSTWYTGNITDGLVHPVGTVSGWSTKDLANSVDISSNPHYLTLDMGSIKTIDRVVFYGRTDDHATSANSGICPCYPENFEIQISADGTNYTTVKTVVGETGVKHSENRRVYELGSAVNARYIRIKTTKLGASTANEATKNIYRSQLHEIEAYCIRRDYTAPTLAVSADTDNRKVGDVIDLSVETTADDVIVTVEDEKGNPSAVADIVNGRIVVKQEGTAYVTAREDSCDVERSVLELTVGHNIVTVEAKAPTYTSVGWNEYEYCTSCDHTTYQEIEMLEVPSVSGDGTLATLAGDGTRRVYWGYIGTENTEYKWFNDFKAQCGDTFTSEFNPKTCDKYLLEKAGYYRFVVNYTDDNGKSVDRVFTFESQGQDVSVPTVTVDGNYAVIATDGADVNKLYYGYIGETETAYAGFDRSVLTEADFSVKDGDNYLLTKAGYYRFVVNYKQGDRLVDKVYTVKVEKDGGVPDVTYADGKIKLSTNGVKVNKLYLAYNGEEAVEVTSWTDYCEKAIARACYLTPADESEYTLANSGCYTVLVNYFDGNKNVDKYFTINN